ncbi:MAG: CapA family protein, partial [Egibacteraceae bacterium]
PRGGVMACAIDVGGPAATGRWERACAAAGDVLVHMPLANQARAYGTQIGADYDFAPMFAEVRAVLEAADLSVCHLEVPLSRDNTDLSGFLLFSAPRQLAAGLAAAGFDTCSTASNHAVDRGGDGVTSTLDALDDAGVKHAGTARSAEEADRPRLYEVADVTVGHVSATYGLNGLALPASEPWRVDLLDPDHVRRPAAAARAAGAEFVVASLHWGEEYRHEPTAGQHSLAEILLADGAVDLIIGHHAHVLQQVGRLAGRPVAFGLGNFLSNQSAACCAAASQDGVIVRFEVEEEAPGDFVVTSTAAVPTWVDRTAYTIVDVLAALDAPETPADRRALLEQSLARTRDVLTTQGETVELVPAEPPADPGPLVQWPPAGVMQ